MKLVQMTDCHLSQAENPQYELSLVRCVEVISKLDADAVVATGDIADDGSSEAYTKFAKITQPIDSVCHWSPGNHDDRKVMERALGHSITKSFKLQNWLIVLLDTSIPNEIPGRIGDAQIAWLDSLLCSHAKNPTAIFMHHHPAPVGCLWIDAQMIEDASVLAGMIARHKQVKFVSNGHVHQATVNHFADVPWYTTPATSRQFARNSADFAIDESERPGFRLFELDSKGEFKTQIIRVD